MTNNSTILFVIAIFTGEFTILILQKYGFKVCVILFGFYSAHFKVYTHLTCINTQNKKQHHSTSLTSYHLETAKKTVLYQGSSDNCEGDRNPDIIRLLHKSQEIHYCNQSVLSIVPDLNIFVFSITTVDLIPRSTLIWSSLLRASYFYNSTGLRFYIYFLEPELRLRYHHFHG